MSNVICFPAIHVIAGAYWHGPNSYPDLEALEDALSERDHYRARAFQQNRERWQNRRNKKRSVGHAHGGNAA